MKMLKGFLLLSYGTTGKQKIYMIISFKLIKEKIGIIKARHSYLISYPAFYNAWANVFRDTIFHLLCECHVKITWVRNLSKINYFKKRETILNNVCLLAEQTDEEKFKQMLQSNIIDINKFADNFVAIMLIDQNYG